MGTGFYGGRFSPSRRCVCISGVGARKKGGSILEGRSSPQENPLDWRFLHAGRCTGKKGLFSFPMLLRYWIPPRHRDRYFPCYRMFWKKSHR